MRDREGRPRTGWSVQLYRTLLRLYPRRFRRAFGAGMVQAFREALEESPRRPGRGAALGTHGVGPGRQRTGRVAQGRCGARVGGRPPRPGKVPLRPGGLGIAHAAARRTREIGIRIALGASGASVRAMVVGRGLALALVGLVVGLLGAVPALRLLRGVLFQVSPFEIEIALVVAALLGAAGVLASFLPARRATRVDPVRALGRE